MFETHASVHKVSAYPLHLEKTLDGLTKTHAKISLKLISIKIYSGSLFKC